MPSYSVSPARRRRPASLVALHALDRGLSLRVELTCAQRPLFSGAHSLSLQQLSSELAELVSQLRVRSFRLRAELEAATTALQHNAGCGFLPLARRAALDLAGLLGWGARRHLADAELCERGANVAFRVAALCRQEVR